MRQIGLDVGDKTVGVAVADELGLTAQGVTTIERRNIKADLAALRELATEYRAGAFIVGLPLNMDGTEGPRAAASRRFGESLRTATGLAVEYWDERLSTAAAERVLLEADISRAKRRKVVDKLAAQVILQSWLDAHRAPADEGD